MSKQSKKEVPKLKHQRIPVTSDIISSIVWRDEKDDEPIAGKIVFLGKENLEKLRGYKAFLDLWADGEVTVTITGLRPKSGRILFNSISQMKDEEIHGD